MTVSVALVWLYHLMTVSVALSDDRYCGFMWMTVSVALSVDDR